jgi:hypothetical protein
MNWAHVHLVANEVPIYGSLFAAVLLLVASFTRAPDDWTRAGLLLLAIGVLGLVVAFLSGIPAVDVINGAPRTSGRALSQHHVRGLVAAGFAVIALAAGVTSSVLARRRGGSYSRRSVVVVACSAIALSAALAWTGQAGGRINHPELQEPADREGGRAHPH